MRTAEAGRGLSETEAAAVQLLQALEARGYDFVTVTPETHRRVVAREGMRVATDLRGVFGWSLPFEQGLIEEELFALMRSARLLRETAAGWKSKARVSTVQGHLFLHSAYPTTSDESVFLGPDTLRFADFFLPELEAAGRVGRLVDIGTGAGVGGILAACALPGAEVTLADINLAALGQARVNAAYAGVEVDTVESDGVRGLEPGFDVAIANPPFIIDEDGPAYRAGGGMHGAELSLSWALEAAEKLAPGGRVILYTGSAIVGGRDPLREALDTRLEGGKFSLRYRELDPDIFGEELEASPYAEVERIAAIGAVISRG